MNYRSVQTVALSQRILLNLTALTATSQAPTSRWRESNRVFAGKPDKVKSGKGGGPCRNTFWPHWDGGLKEEPVLVAEQVFLILLCSMVFEVAISCHSTLLESATRGCHTCTGVSQDQSQLIVSTAPRAEGSTHLNNMHRL